VEEGEVKAIGGTCGELTFISARLEDAGCR